MLVAVYGTLKKHYGNHRILKDGQAKFVDYKSFPGLMFHMGWFPGVVLAEDVAADHPCHLFVSRYTISTEIYEVDDPTLLKLDKLEGHPKFYYRTPMKDARLGEVHIYTQRAAKQLHGMKNCISGGFWYGEHTSIMEVNFGDGTVKPKIVCWRGGSSSSKPTIVIPPTNKEEVITPPISSGITLQHHNAHAYEDWDDAMDAEFTLPSETEIDLTILDQVKEA